MDSVSLESTANSGSSFGQYFYWVFSGWDGPAFAGMALSVFASTAKSAPGSGAFATIEASFDGGTNYQQLARISATAPTTRYDYIVPDGTNPADLRVRVQVNPPTNLSDTGTISMEVTDVFVIEASSITGAGSTSGTVTLVSADAELSSTAPGFNRATSAAAYDGLYGGGVVGAGNYQTNGGAGNGVSTYDGTL